jgi:hypothetical protein
LSFKKSLLASEQYRPDIASRRHWWRACQGRLDPQRLVFLDETWVKTNMAPLRVWCAQGQRLPGHAPGGHWKTMTFLGAFRISDGTRRSFNNTQAGFRKLRSWIGQRPCARVVYEPIGDAAAAAILIECPGIGSPGRKKAASLAVLAPMIRQSGQWKGQAFIQGGRKFLKDALYMPALVAIRFNPDMKQKYQNMIKNGKPTKIAITAIMRKLIILADTLIDDNRKWVQNNP